LWGLWTPTRKLIHLVDGNKRTGFVNGVLFLELNGYRFTASEEAAQVILELAAGAIDEIGLCEFLRENTRRERK
jgi:death-on-curing protein